VNHNCGDDGTVGSIALVISWLICDGEQAAKKDCSEKAQCDPAREETHFRLMELSSSSRPSAMASASTHRKRMMKLSSAIAGLDSSVMMTLCALYESKINRASRAISSDDVVDRHVAVSPN